MVESPELVRISLKLYDFTVDIQGVLFKGSCPSELNYDMSVSLKDIPFLNQSSVHSHLKALLYEIPDSPSGFDQLDRLTKEAGQSTLAVFSEPNQEFGNVYLIGRNDDSSVGASFSGSKFGLFVYHYKEILGDDPSNYVSFIRLLKIAKSSFIQKTQKKYEELEDKKEEKKHFEELSEYLTKRSEKLKEELETAKQAIQQLNYQLEKKRTQVKERQEQNLECIVCKSNMKDVVFLPCGHIIICKTCMIETMNVHPGSVISKRNPVKCPLCKNPVKESKEIHF